MAKIDDPRTLKVVVPLNRAERKHLEDMARRQCRTLSGVVRYLLAKAKEEEEADARGRG